MTDSYNPRARIPSRQVATAPPSNSVGPVLTEAPAMESRLMLPVARVGTPKIAEAIASVEREIGIINKGGFNKFHGYKYARVEDILEAVTPLMGQNGLSILQSEIDVQQVETRVVVKHEFHVIHTSGEIQGPFYKYGMSSARDSKGNYDDKCLNKAHTQARRYFIVGLFNIPTAELDDNERSEQRQPQKEKERAPVPPRGERKDDTHIKPQKIGLGAGVGAGPWAERYIQMIGQTVSKQEVIAWDKLNTDALQSLMEGFPEIYERVCVAIETKAASFPDDTTSQPKPRGTASAMAAAENVASHMPDPAKDAVAACNWVAQHLTDLKTQVALDAFWNQVVRPAESKFLPPDFEELLKEYRRAEARLGIFNEGAADAEEATDKRS